MLGKTVFRVLRVTSYVIFGNVGVMSLINVEKTFFRNCVNFFLRKTFSWGTRSQGWENIRYLFKYQKYRIFLCFFA